MSPPRSQTARAVCDGPLLVERNDGHAFGVLDYAVSRNGSMMIVAKPRGDRRAGPMRYPARRSVNIPQDNAALAGRRPAHSWPADSSACSMGIESS